VPTQCRDSLFLAIFKQAVGTGWIVNPEEKCYVCSIFNEADGVQIVEYAVRLAVVSIALVIALSALPAGWAPLIFVCGCRLVLSVNYAFDVIIKMEYYPRFS